MSEAVVTPDGRFRFGRDIHRCALGAGGVRADKREGDHATPTGMLPLRRLFYRADRIRLPAAAVPRELLAPEDGWCDDITTPHYNTRIRLPAPVRHEALWRDDDLYDLIGVLGWNDAPVQPGRGSAIFLHIARPDFAPTEGCIALERTTLLRVLAEGLTAIRVIQ